MSDLISRHAAIEMFEPWLKVDGYSEGELNMLKAVLYELRFLPSAQPERKKGKWVPLQSSTDNLYYQCSCCRRNAPMVGTGCLMNRRLEALLTDFCPNCGANMKGEEDE